MAPLILALLMLLMIIAPIAKAAKVSIIPNCQVPFKDIHPSSIDLLPPETC